MKAVWKILCLLAISVSASAHTPHHVIDALKLSPDYDNDSTLFVLVHNYLLRSTERGARWRHLVNGIDTPHVLSDIAISGEFAIDDTLFVASDGGGIFKSSDRGQNWDRFNSGLRHRSIGKLLVAAGDNGPMLLAAGSARGLFSSPVQEAGWRRLISDDVQVTALAVIAASGSSFALAGDSTGGIWKSDANLQNWQRIARHDAAGNITSFAAGPARGEEETLLVGTQLSGLLQMSDSGEILEHLSRQWPEIAENCSGRPLATPNRDQHVRDVHSNDGGASLLVTTWNRAVHVSRDSGLSWSVESEGLRCNVQADAEGFSTPHFRDLAIGGVDQQDWFLASFDGLFRSVDRGKSWVPFETMPVGLIRGAGISAANESGHTLVLTTYGGGAYISADQGRSWKIANHGLVSTRLADAEFSPAPQQDPQLFALSREQLLSRAGINNAWHVNSIVYSGWRSQVGFAADYLLDSSERRGVWPMQLELSPSFATDQTMLVGTRRRGVWISSDSGAEWDRTWQGRADYVTDLTISPDFPADGTAFAGIRGAGIYVTRDGAQNWQPSNSGFEFFENHLATESPNHFVDPPLSRAISDVVLAVSPDFAADQAVFAGSAEGLFRSADGGKTWSRLALPVASKRYSVVGLGISPGYGTDGMIMVSVRGHGLFASTDSGQSFHPTGQNLRQMGAEPRFILFSPGFGTDGIIYGASDWDLYLSRDKGATWDIVERPVRYEDARGNYAGPMWFTKGWDRETGRVFSASTQTVSSRPGAKASLNFAGRAIEWMGERSPSGGKAKIIVDGIEVGIADLYAEQESSSISIFELSGLRDEPHTLAIEVLDAKNPRSSGQRVTIDSIDVLRH